METKVCSKCKEIKTIDNFRKAKGYKYGLFYCCKECEKERYKIYCQNNPEKIKAIKRKYYDNNTGKVILASTIWRKDNSEKYKKSAKKWYDNNPEKIKLWRENNIEKVRVHAKKNQRKKRLNTKFRISSIVSSSINKSLNSNKNGQHWETLVNFTIKDLMTHLEKQFKIGMSWGNKNEWHIDHVIPVSLWKFESYIDREFKQCWSLCNLQPLWASENIRKSNKVA